MRSLETVGYIPDRWSSNSETPSTISSTSHCWNTNRSHWISERKRRRILMRDTLHWLPVDKTFKRKILFVGLFRPIYIRVIGSCLYLVGYRCALWFVEIYRCRSFAHRLPILPSPVLDLLEQSTILYIGTVALEGESSIQSDYCDINLDATPQSKLARLTRYCSIVTR